MKLFRIIILFSLSSIILVAPLFGEGGGEHHFDWIGFFGKTLNSSILIALLIVFLRKPIVEMLSKKSVEIREDIMIREKELKDHKKYLMKTGSRLDKIEIEVGIMLKEAKKNGELEAKRIKELAKTESERIIKNNSEEIEARIESSLIDLKKKIADMTIEEFRSNFRSILTMDLHKKIIDKNIEISGEIIEKG